MRSACQRWVDKRTGEHRRTAEALAEMQRAILGALQGGEPLDAEMRQDLAFAFEYLCAGIAADLLTPRQSALVGVSRLLPRRCRRQQSAICDGWRMDGLPIQTRLQPLRTATKLRRER